MKNSSRLHVQRLCISALSLACALLLPFLTGQIQKIGSMLCPMHIPVMLCGFLCGPVWAAATGLVAPLLRYALFGMPPIFPMGVSMSAELAVYGFVCGALSYLISRRSKSLRIGNVYATLAAAMVAGRLVYGVVRLVLVFTSGVEYSLHAYLTGTVLEGLPGIVLQLILIPPAVLAAEKLMKGNRVGDSNEKTDAKGH